MLEKRRYAGVWLALAAMMVVPLAACSSATGTGSGGSTPSADSGKTYKMIVGTTSASGSLEVQALKGWSDAVAKATDGRMKISILPDGQLGNELATQEAIISGDIQGVSGGITGVKQWDILAASYIFKSADQMMAVMHSPIVDPWRKAWLDQSGIEVVGFLERLPRTLTANREIKTPADLHGLNIRVPGTDVNVETWKVAGASPVTIPSQEVYTALQTGVVGAQENALDTAFAQRIMEVQKYVILTAHCYMPQLVGVSAKYMDSLPGDIAKAVRDEMGNTEKWLSQQLKDQYPKMLDKIKAQGDQVVTPDVAAFRKVMLPVTKKYTDQVWGPGVLEKIQAFQG